MNQPIFCIALPPEESSRPQDASVPPESRGRDYQGLHAVFNG